MTFISVTETFFEIQSGLNDEESSKVSHKMPILHGTCHQSYGNHIPDCLYPHVTNGGM